MSGQMKRKTLVLLCMQMICIVAMALFLIMIQYRLAMNSQQKELAEKLEQIDELIDASDDTMQQMEDIFDNIYCDKVESLAYMVREQVDPLLTQSVMGQYCGLLDVDNVLVLDTEGNILAQAHETPARFERSRYNMLRTVFSDHQLSEPFSVEIDGVHRDYYGAWIDRQRMAVVEVNTDADDLDLLLSDTVSWEALLEDENIGLHGYSFVISTPDYRFYYHPDHSLMGQDALAAGLRAEDLQDGNITWFELNGEKFYGGVTQYDNLYVINVISAEEIYSESAITVGIVLFMFIAVSTAVIAYAIALHNENGKSHLESSDYWYNGKVRIHRQTGAKIAFVSVFGLICILFVSMLMQTLYSLSGVSVAFAQRFVDVENDAVRYSEDLEMLTDNYNQAYLSKAQTAAYILEKKPELINRSDLAALSDVLNVEYIFVFDSNGVMTATDSPYSHFSISQNKEDQSYEFNELLQGVPYLIQEARFDDVEHIYRQYVGVTLRDEAGEADGFVQIAVSPELLEDAVSNMDAGVTLRYIEIGTNGFAFAVDSETKDFVWHPDDRKIGQNALDHGVDEDMFVSGVSEFITLDNEMYYAAVEEIDDNYIFLTVPRSEIGGQRLAIAIATTLFSLIALSLIGITAVVESDSPDLPVRHRKAIMFNHGRERMSDVPVGDETKKTESVFSRWCNVIMRWGERTPEQKVMFFIKGMMFALAAFVCLAVANKERFFSSTSVIRYVISGTWKRGFNIFSFTACITIIIVVFAGTALTRSILRLLARCLDARKETIIRLISNLVEYAALIATIYYCLALFGVNTSALLASAGVLSLVIGLGAQSLITDILAGLFIIFEGEFRVGDIVTIGDWRGRVVEIGVRTTKVENTSGNIKIFNNSTISGVINMTQKESGAMCEVAIDLNENLERVEEILKEEFPDMRKRLEPMIVNGPFYSGVSELSDRGITLRIIAICSEADRKRLTRKLNREIKLMFDKHNIRMALPQVVVHESSDFVVTSEWQEPCMDPKSDGESEKPSE